MAGSFAKVEADQQGGIGAQGSCRAPQKGAGARRIEIADGRSGKEPERREVRQVRGQGDRLLEIRGNRTHDKVGTRSAQPDAHGLERRHGNIDGDISADERPLICVAHRKQMRRLCFVARAELDQRDMIGTALQVRRQRRQAGIQERVLGSGQIIFRQFRDALE